MARNMTPQARAAAAKIPFRYGSRQRFAPLPVQTGAAYASGGQFSAELPRVGFLSHIWVQLTGTMNLAMAGALTTRGPWDLINELIVRVNVGAATIYRTTGYGNFVLQRALSRLFDVSGASGPPADADLYAAGVAMGNNTWTLTYWIPVAQNYGKQSHLGLINLQAPEIQVNLEGRFGAPTDVVTNVGTGFTGTLNAGYLYYEVPDPNRVMYPPLLFFRTIESAQTIVAIGDQTYTFPREGLVHRAFHVVQANDVRTNGVSRVRLVFNKTDDVYRYDRWQLKMLQNYLYAAPLPTGVFAHEWWGAESVVGEGDNRDMISSEALSTLESVVTTTAAVGGTLNRLDTIRQFSQIVAL